jgi:predicted metal-dependent enzyme (double-stranded beta helix superfamily)
MRPFAITMRIGIVIGSSVALGALLLLTHNLLSAAGTVAQPTLLLENNRVRVWSLTLEPGQSTAQHTHELDEIVICLEGSRIKSRKPGPEPEGETFQPNAGEVFMPPVKGVTHILTNVGPTRYKQISIELKEPQPR